MFCLVFVCLLTTSNQEKTTNQSFMKFFTRDVSLDKQVLNKFWKSSKSGSGSRNFLKEFLPLCNQVNSASSADISRSCRQILMKFFEGWDVSQKRTFDFDDDLDHDLAQGILEFLPVYNNNGYDARYIRRHSRGQHSQRSGSSSQSCSDQQKHQVQPAIQHSCVRSGGH